jgi:hypothetical protein
LAAIGDGQREIIDDGGAALAARPTGGSVNCWSYVVFPDKQRFFDH